MSGPKAHRRFRGTLEARFWPKVQVAGPDECWLWNGSVTRKGAHGYGRIMKEPGRLVVAHRVAWEIANGPIPEGMVVCHRCDVARCVNVAHLWLGTQKDNMQDASHKGRVYAQTHVTPGGDLHPLTVHSDALCTCMRMDVAFARMSEVEVAQQYGLPVGSVRSLLWSGRRRRHLPTIAELRRRDAEGEFTRRLDKIEEARAATPSLTA